MHLDMTGAADASGRRLLEVVGDAPLDTICRSDGYRNLVGLSLPLWTLRSVDRRC